MSTLRKALNRESEATAPFTPPGIKSVAIRVNGVGLKLATALPLNSFK
jgi:hypothetical protein